METEITTPTATIRRDAQGVMYLIASATDETLETARHNVEIILQLADQEDFLLVVDMRKAGDVSREAQQLYAGPEATGRTRATAFVVGSVEDVIAIDIFMRLQQPLRPMRSFSDEAEAAAWLLSFASA